MVKKSHDSVIISYFLIIKGINTKYIKYFQKKANKVSILQLTNFKQIF